MLLDLILSLGGSNLAQGLSLYLIGGIGLEHGFYGLVWTLAIELNIRAHRSVRDW